MKAKNLDMLPILKSIKKKEDKYEKIDFVY